MSMKSILLAGTIIPFTLGIPAVGVGTAAAQSSIVIAQADAACPEGQECPEACVEGVEGQECPPEEQLSPREERRKARQERRQQEQQQEAPAAEQQEAPAAEQQEAPAAEQQEAPAAEQQPAPEQQAAPEPQAPVQQQAQPEVPPQPETQVQPQMETQSQQVVPIPPAPESTTAPSDTTDQRDSREERRQRREERRKQRAEGQEQAPAPVQQPAQTQQPQAPAPETQSTVEQQLEAQGEGEEANQVRRLLQKLRQQEQQVLGDEPTPQAGREGRDSSAGTDGRRERREGDGEVVEQRGDRLIIQFGNQIYVEPRYGGDNERFLRGARDVEVRELRGGRTETTVYRRNGVKVVTVTDRYGDVIRRVRILPNGQEIVLYDMRDEVRAGPPVIFERELPPLIVEIPREEYIVETRRASVPQVYEAFTAPPVERVERAYTLEEVQRSERLRDKVRRVDLDTITFDFGSATIGMEQLDALDSVGEAIVQALEQDPSAVFLIEGHTDAVGSDYDNLLLSDRRAEAVAVALSEDFDIPPENLVTQGYGEQYLKVETQKAERENRRVTMRNITPLLQAQK